MNTLCLDDFNNYFDLISGRSNMIFRVQPQYIAIIGQIAEMQSEVLFEQPTSCPDRSELFKK